MTTKTDTVPTAPSSGERSRSSLLRMQFPYKLHVILGDAKKKKFDDIIAWSPHGRSFRVFSKERFETEVMEHYFDSNKYKTFQRNLNLWGYQVGENKEIVHKDFVRDKLDLCEKMHRVKIKGAYIRGTRSPKAPIAEPLPSSLQLQQQRGKWSSLMEADLRARMVGGMQPQLASPQAASSYQERARLLSLLNTTAPDLNLRHAIANAVHKHQYEVETRATALMHLLAAEAEERRLPPKAPSLVQSRSAREIDPVAQALYTSMDISQSTTSPHAASLLAEARMKSISQIHHQRTAAPTQGYNLNLFDQLLSSGSRI